MLKFDLLSRRGVLAGAAGLVLAPRVAFAAAPITFAVLRNGAKIGEHHMQFAGDGDEMTATADVAMSVKLGPVPVFRYRHHAREQWSGGRFATLETRSDVNGKSQTVSAERGVAGVTINCPAGRLSAPANATPLTHWTARSFTCPLFNPQDGKLLKIVVRRVAPSHWSVRGEAEIDDWYDEAGAWSALRGRLKDGSTVEYRRI